VAVLKVVDCVYHNVDVFHLRRGEYSLKLREIVGIRYIIVPCTRPVLPD